MVKYSDIILETIPDVLEEYKQLQIKHQYEKMLENTINNNFNKTDISRLIESIKIGDE